MSSHQPPAAIKLDPEFSFPDADLCLRSSDGVFFAAHRVILNFVSVVLRDMLLLPQPQTLDEDPFSDQNIVQMYEDAWSLRMLLKFGYPRPLYNGPELTSIPSIESAAFLAHKYSIKSLHEHAEKALIRCDSLSPALAYGVAWKFGYRTALHIVARRSLGVPRFFTDHLDEHIDAPVLANLPAKALIHLQRYHSTVQKRLGLFTSITSRDNPITWIEPDEIDAIPRHGNSVCQCQLVVVWFRPHDINISTQWHVYSWWFNYSASVIASWQPENPNVLATAVDIAFLESFKSAMLCGASNCPGKAAALRVLSATRAALQPAIEDQIKSVSFPNAILE